SSIASSRFPTSPSVAQPAFDSAFPNAVLKAFSPFSMHLGSTATALIAALAWQSSSADAYLPVAFRLSAAHFPPSFVPPSLSAPTVDCPKPSTVVTTAPSLGVVPQPPFASAFVKAFANTVPALLRQPAFTAFSFRAALAWHASLAAAFFATAFSLAERHLASGVGFASAALAATRPRTATARRNRDRASIVPANRWSIVESTPWRTGRCAPIGTGIPVHAVHVCDIIVRVIRKVAASASHGPSTVK